MLQLQIELESQENMLLSLLGCNVRLHMDSFYRGHFCIFKSELGQPASLGYVDFLAKGIQNGIQIYNTIQAVEDIVFVGSANFGPQVFRCILFLFCL